MLRLCGGTAFILISNARKEMLSKSENYQGNSSGITESELLSELASIANSQIGWIDPKSPSIVNNTSNFKACKNWGGTTFAFNKSATRIDFQNRFENKYESLVSQMDNVVDRFLDAKKDEYLVKALIELIIQDDTIKDDETFYFGDKVTKATLRNISEVCLSRFLLGIWFYVLTRIDENSVGQETFEIWCPKNNQGRREYQGTIGEESKLTIQVKRGNTEKTDVGSAPINEIAEITMPEPNVEDAGCDTEYSEQDDLLLKEFQDDYDEIILTCISDKFAQAMLDGLLLTSIADLFESKWRTKSEQFQDMGLKSNIQMLLVKLNEFCMALDPKIHKPHMPIRTLQKNIRNLNMKLHPDEYLGIFPYGAFMDDYDEGEEY